MLWFAIILILQVLAAAAGPTSLISIPSGRLQIGVKEWVDVPSFTAMRTPVTNAEFIAFLRVEPLWGKSKVPRVFADSGYLEQFASDLRLKKDAHRSAPVTSVSWFAARAYCESMGLRLPRVVEWEYMGQANEKLANASQDADFLQKILAWYAEPRGTGGLPLVGRGKANFFGVQDLHGLIWEWTEDFNSGLMGGEGRSEGALNRDLFCGAGSGAGANKEDYAAYMRFAFRSSLKGASTVWNLGFRCVKEGLK